MVREIQFDDEVLRRAMEANDATDEAKLLEDALCLGLRIKAQAGIWKLRGIGWDGDLEAMRLGRSFDAEN